MNCPQCNCKIAKDAAFCPVCGTPQALRVRSYDRVGKRILRLIEPHVQEDEMVREYTVGNSKIAVERAEARFLLNSGKFLLRLGIAVVIDALTGVYCDFTPAVNMGDSMIVLTSRRMLIARITGWSQWSMPVQITNVKGIPLTQIKGMEYERGPLKGTLTIRHDDGETEFAFWISRWGRHAKNMVALFKQAQGVQSLVMLA
jgi:hypothetical protein